MNSPYDEDLPVEAMRERDPARYDAKAWYRYDFEYMKEILPKEYTLRTLPPVRK
jgi:hypothetical protein